MDQPAADPTAVLRSRGYTRLLILAALTGVPISAIAYGFLKLVAASQNLVFKHLPDALGFDTMPSWWPIPAVAVGGLLTALAIERLPGSGGHSPADGFKAGGATAPIELPGVAAAALATLVFGAVLGPEAPLIAIGSGLGVLAIKALNRDAPERAVALIAAAGSFAAIASLVGSPLIGAFLLLEAAGLGGPMLGVVLVPGLLSSGLGALVFLGLNKVTGFGTLSLSIPDLPPFDRLTLAMFLWAIPFGLAAAVLGTAIRRAALELRPIIERRRVVLMPLLGIIVGGLATLFAALTDKAATEVLFSGQSAIPDVIVNASTWTTGALIAVVACKGLAYALCLSSFRGGPIFPALFIGAAAGAAAAGLPGMSLIPAVAMGIGAMSVVMLSLPMTSTLMAALLLGSDGAQALPVVIVAVVVAYVASARLTPMPEHADVSAEKPDEALEHKQPA